MSRIAKTVTVLLLVPVLLAGLFVGCANGKEAEGVTITIGELTDLTGPASTALRPIHYVIEDVIRHYNDEAVIPGVKIKLATYNTHYDPARTLPGWDWLKGKGAKFVITIMAADALLLKSRAEEEKTPISCMGTTIELLEPPGWVFSFSTTPGWNTKTILKWIAEHEWDGQQPAKIGYCGWAQPHDQEVAKAMREYCQEYQGQFELVGTYLPPVGTMSFVSEAQKLKGCDYVFSVAGMAVGNVMRDYFAVGGKGKLVDPVGVLSADQGYLSDLLGWSAIDGWLTILTALTFTTRTSITTFLYDLLRRYRSPAQVERIMHDGGYAAPGHQVIPMLEVLKKAAQEVGIENLDGQAYYNAALTYKTTWEDYPEWGFSNTKRYLMNQLAIHKYSAEKKDLVWVSGWEPIVK
ncbi:MAG: ABC transporter substrate-binding protein [Chloroflexi bacterium]|nr:ABC transporter substrate-binding protein [Chloroflexota bacterium]